MKSSYCYSCAYWKNKKGTPEYFKWFETHGQTCVVNYSESAGKMEVDLIKEMFLRFEEEFGVKYTNYIGDGVSKTFKAFLDLQLYGEDIILKKSKCVGYVKKRMGTQLRNIKKVKKLGSKGKLTNTLITKLMKYYGLTIKRHPDSMSEIKKAVMTTYYHMCSTDENPQYQYYSLGVESWYKWRVAEVTGKLDEFVHHLLFPKRSKIICCQFTKIYPEMIY